MCKNGNTGSQQTCAQKVCTNIDFSHIRELCEKDRLQCDVDLTPHVFAEHRRDSWPDPDFGSANACLAEIYNSVKATGIPNAMGARRLIPSSLNIHAWEKYLVQTDQPLLDLIKFGFPMGYVGPVSDTTHVPNHPSATQFPEQVSAFVSKEISLGGIMGPLASPPFTQWSHVSPLMTRPKATVADRRVITDLTYPRATSVNSYIRKNTVMGMTQTHCLPSVDAVVQRVQEIGNSAHMFTADIS